MSGNDVNFGENLNFIGFSRVLSTLLHTIYGHFWLPPAGHEVAAISDTLLDVVFPSFQILPLGGAKLFSLDIILEEICILFSHS